MIPDEAGRTPEALQKLVESEVARWTPVLKAAGAVAELEKLGRLPTAAGRARRSRTTAGAGRRRALKSRTPPDYTAGAGRRSSVG